MNLKKKKVAYLFLFLRNQKLKKYVELLFSPEIDIWLL